MGDLRPWSPEPDGAAFSEERPSSSSSSSSSSLSNLTVISDEYWERAEAFAQRIIAQVQPTLVSLHRRKSVIDYVQRLIKNSLGCEVFPFGSVPLKTYLPDGDIDLTAFGGMNVDEALANDVCFTLERENQNKNADFVVKDVQLIRAEVKLVKCLVQNIVVDISFNQLGGLCTLCFLEKVDHLIGKDHLFKRSIILIKAWCYYESRILGAHHGLISTYALETLVLYVFNVFHSSLTGPFAVLYKFLDYFSKFDWDNYCISLNGPVRISSLSEFVVEAPENGRCNLLLTSDFLKECTERFSIPARGSDQNSRTFPPKHLNIVDPLKENNNLGRSVSKGNFYRIRSAFTYGARKLGRILTMPEESITVELSKFFSNTLDRHGSGQRPDVLDHPAIDEAHEFGNRFSFSGAESSQEDLRFFEREYQEQPMGGENVQVSMRKMSFDTTVDELPFSPNEAAVSEYRISGDAEEVATCRMQRLSISNDAPMSSSPPGVERSLSPMGKAHDAPHFHHISGFALENGEMRDGNLDHGNSGVVSAPAEDLVHATSNCLDERHLNAKNPMPQSSKGNSSLETLNSFVDLTGDYENHLNNLQHGRWWYEYAFSAASVPPMSPQMRLQFPGKNSWDLIRRSVQFRKNGTSQMNVGSVVNRPFFYPANAPLLPSAAFGMEELQKPRGTGTYFPNTNHYRDRTSAGRGRNEVASRSPRPNGRIIHSQEANFPDRNYRDNEHPLIHHGSGKFISSDLQNGSFEGRHGPNANGFMHLPDSGGYIQPVSTEAPWHPDPGSHNSYTSQPQGSKPIVSIDQNRDSMKSYQLVEDDFPPLSDSSRKGLPFLRLRSMKSLNSCSKHEVVGSSLF